MTKNLYCFVGQSGSGKDTIVNTLCDMYGYSKVISCTTRPPRNTVIDQKSHIFKKAADYIDDKNNGRIIADTVFDGNYYWATEQMVDEADFYIVDIAGYQLLQQKYRNRPIVGIFIDASEFVRTQRMTQRGDSIDSVIARLENDRKMFTDANDIEWDFCIVNNSSTGVESVVRKIQNFIISNEKQNVKLKKLYGACATLSMILNEPIEKVAKRLDIQEDLLKFQNNREEI